MKKYLLIGIGTAITAAAAFFLWNRKKDGRVKPPKKAPQLKVENPGDQSEFTTAPSDSELG
jgi:LPXTG-motif cell wall-anchored protein